jgi:PmbA protein
VAIGLLGHFVVAASGGNLYRKSSFLLDQLGQQIFPDFVAIEEKPHIRKGLASTTFDNDGVRTRDRNVVTHGRLDGYFLSMYSARKLGMPTTANSGGSHNLILSNTGHTFDELLKKMDRGLIVTEVLGQGVNYVTGTYSRGISGFWIDRGEIQYPVEEITIAGNLTDMFKSIVAIGNDTLIKGGKQSGSVLIESMMVAGDD